MLKKSVTVGLLTARSVINTRQNQKMVYRSYRMEGPTAPFDNMPFSVPNRYVATVAFTIFVGSGLWAPYFILWYSMAKRTL